MQLLHHLERDSMDYISIFNYDAAGGYEENKLYRHILPTQAGMLELDRLSNFEVERRSALHLLSISPQNSPLKTPLNLPLHLLSHLPYL